VNGIRYEYEHKHLPVHVGVCEDSMQTEKRRGYYYEHPFSYNWNAMKGYHYLMRLAHAMNALAQHT
jgi:hypothetical protein